MAFWCPLTVTDDYFSVFYFICIIFILDFLYQHRVAFDGAVSEVEILDTSNCAVSYFIYRCLTTDRFKNFISDLFVEKHICQGNVITTNFVANFKNLIF